MNRVLVATALTAGMAFLGAQAARADVITQNFAFADLSGYTSESGPTLSGFNSALGTLTSVDVSDSVTATWSAGGATDQNFATYFFHVGQILGLTLGNIGNGTLSVGISQTYSDSASLAVFTGGSLATSVNVENIGGTTATLASTFGTETLTYNYTPATTSVPEPGSLALLGTGLLGLALLRRRRRR